MAVALDMESEIEMDTRVTRGTLPRSGLLAAVCCLPLFAGAAPPAAPACNDSAEQVRLRVRVAGVSEAGGNVTITVYPDESDRFLAKGGKLARQRVAAVSPTTTACFALPAAGTYAIAVYHDANDDHDFNRSFVGMPSEGFGFSGNPKSRLGLPELKEVRFDTQPGDNPVEIRLTYP